MPMTKNRTGPDRAKGDDYSQVNLIYRVSLVVSRVMIRHTDSSSFAPAVAITGIHDPPHLQYHPYT